MTLSETRQAWLVIPPTTGGFDHGLMRDDGLWAEACPTPRSGNASEQVAHGLLGINAEAHEADVHQTVWGGRWRAVGQGDA